MKKRFSASKLLTLLICTFLFVSIMTCSNSKKQVNEKNWIHLFNGKDLKDWKIKFSGHELNDNYKNTFQVANGVLRVCYDQYEQFDNKFGHIFYNQKFSHYVLHVEYRFIGDQVAEGPGWAFRNNGIMLHCQSPESMMTDQNFPVSLEAQLLGGNDSENRTTGNLCTPGTHVVMDGKLLKDHCITSISETYHGDQWVTIEIEVHGSEKIMHRIDNKTVIEYEKPQLDPEDPYARILIDEGFPLMLSEGYIALQAESHPTEFRTVKLLELK